MAFLETPRLKDCIAFSAKGGPGFSVDVISTRAGYESRNANWTQTRHRWDIGFTTRPLSEFEMIRDHFMAVGGRRDGFRFKDFTDYQVSSTNGILKALHGTAQVGPGTSGYGTPVYQLQKRYSRGVNNHDRDIRKPSLTALYRGGVLMVAGVGVGQYAIDTATGLVTVVADQSRVISSQTPGSSHQIILASAFSPNVALAGRVYITGVTGTAATALNNLSHEVSTVVSATINITTNTAGLTASGGTAFYYPQPTESVSWAGEFDVPVRFDVDQFDSVIVNRKGAGGELLIELPSIPVVEIRV